ncbi:benenodin family lasso peptide [Luteimonas sp. BDR2-5]|uniref:benenodin family lasso peptide n=1 Tax=Proluteimonas luteida TaxID=2878685 RepID=UPI001E3BC375|nr:benenodin family lasso peptide [Luteimonas sp. BDR2-5]MCD9026778.1 benenodin family lasso peptide [Luteimonas sp. BDR2-5]
MKVTNETIERIKTSEDVIVLGAISVETRGEIGSFEMPGTGGPFQPGISEE